MKTLVNKAPRLALGVTPSSAALSRFLKGRKPSSSILPHMPAELVQTIASFLPMPALGNLRLTCKELEVKILWYFAKTYFREMKFMHSKYALEALVAMSKSRMAQYVQKLALGPPSNDQSVVIFSGQEPKSAAVRQQITRALYRYAEENRTMRAFGHDAAMIQTAFQNLSAITKMEFLAPTQDCVCPFCSPLSSYGERHLIESVGGGKAGFAPTVLDSSQSLGRLLHITLSAAQSAGLKLECVDARTTPFPDEYTEESQKTGFAAYPLTFPSAPPGERPSDSAFARLSNMKLFLGHHQDTCNAGRRTQLVQRLVTFFDRAPALESLGFTFQEGHGTFECLKQLTHSPPLWKIKRLELSSFDFKCTELFDILDPLRNTLQTLHLSFFKVDDGFEMLRWFRDRMTSLNEVDLEHLQEYPTPARYGSAALSLQHALLNSYSNSRYKGDSIGKFFDETIDKWMGHESAQGKMLLGLDDDSD